MQGLLQREADIAVRMMIPTQNLLIARRVGKVKVRLYAHADYLQRQGIPSTLMQLLQHALIGFDEETPFVRAAGKKLPAWTRDAFSLRTDSDLGQLALIRAGYGIGFCQVALAKRDPNLIRILPEQCTLVLDTWVTMHEDLRNSPRCKTTFDALVLCLQHHVTAATEH